MKISDLHGNYGVRGKKWFEEHPNAYTYFPIVDKIPNGWCEIWGQTPPGYILIHNKKSFFDKERKCAYFKLIK